MKKLLIIITCIASLSLAGCWVPGSRLVHKIDVQQGNVLDQDDINLLEPGMSRRTYEGMERAGDAEHRVWYVAVTRAKERLFLGEPDGLYRYDMPR